jgi:ABC-type transport system involved in cytochrome c biogenesis permease subunit
LKRFLLAILLLILNCHNLEAKDLSQFKRILIADQGRIKPLDSFSKSLLLQISGQTKGHIEWLAESLFKPELANKKNLFLIENPELKEALKLDQKRKRFSFNEIERVSQKLFELTRQIASKEEKDYSLLDKQVLILRANFYSYINITNVFLFSIPNNAFTVSDELRDELLLESNRNSLYDILQKSDILSTRISEINNKNQEMNIVQKGLIELSLAVYAWVENFRNFDDTFISETRFCIIPKVTETTEWQSPWQVIYNPSKNTKSYLWLLSQTQKNYDNDKEFNKNILEFNEKVIKDIKYNKIFIEAEIFYNAINPFKYALLFYLVTILSLLFSIYTKSTNYRLALSTTLIAFSLNTLGLILRIIIMQRAPVSNIYETFIFIAWAIALIGLIIYLIEKNQIGLIVSSICGFMLLLISFKFAAEGDTMKALIAVLNSNFWLSTHVIAITLGYAGVFAAGVLGHIFIIQKISKATEQQYSKTKSYLLGILGFGLVMSFLGTLLGGIWADQSWGRFWGWDPKENGALLIVLWCALIFHARLSGFIKDIGLAQTSVFGCIIVMLSWLGVNLLGVGLHSYGFTSGLAYSLLAYAVIEVLFVLITSFILKTNYNSD